MAARDEFGETDWWDDAPGEVHARRLPSPGIAAAFAARNLRPGCIPFRGRFRRLTLGPLRTGKKHGHRGVAGRPGLSEIRGTGITPRPGASLSAHPGSLPTAYPRPPATNLVVSLFGAASSAQATRELTGGLGEDPPHGARDR